MTIGVTQTETDRRNLLFISHTDEDQVFAKWLARKLEFCGYGAWIDESKSSAGLFGVPPSGGTAHERKSA